MISSAIWTQYTITDIRTDTRQQQRPCLRIASRGKKYLAITDHRTNRTFSLRSRSLVDETN